MVAQIVTWFNSTRPKDDNTRELHTDARIVSAADLISCGLRGKA